MLREAPFAEGEIYHLYNRGVDKRKIFLDDADQTRFLALLYLCNSKNPLNIEELRRKGSCKGETFTGVFEKVDRGERLVNIGAWCFMPNHFHLMVRERASGGITEFMRKLSTGYTMYFNKKQERSGALFEGAFKSRHVGEEGYLNWLFSYIHLNPVKLIEPKWKEEGALDQARTANYLKEYPWSSYQDYFGAARPERAVISPEEFPEHFKNFDDVKALLEMFSREFEE